ncbi:endoplasmic reticulum oxidoreductin-2-like [Carica papaya]|uniref:endoplasmic reticulum oxidoreductin-2-like n=1 Tax=Carica papaya TaxID=3649 RepID=UPI000B8CABE2|nr:endoplasmic reticulum oxidoreductin-2-like [Carica papaya]
MAETEVRDNKEKRSEKKRWGWVFGAFLSLLIAIAMTACNTQRIPLFGRSDKSCHLDQGKQKYIGIVEDCRCDYETVNRLNKEVLHSMLQDIVKTPFFRYFKVKLWCDCPFWPDDGMCRLRDCSVCECQESEFPESFKKPFPSDDPVCQEGKPQAAVDRTLESKAFRGWTETDNPWTYDDETDNDQMTYVNLQLNPERYTGYSGPSARRIWDAVYSENCPKYPSDELCQEERILYKLISGLHSSISIHIASDYLLDEAKNLTQSLMKQLLHNSELQAACPVPFDEAKLWKGESGPELKQKIQKQFRNISTIMDCVGCEKCRLWGKLQVLGLGTALKILFSENGGEDLGHSLELQRNEVIALMNLLNRLSESVSFVYEMGPTTERIMEGNTTGWSSLWRRILASGKAERELTSCLLA